jgi:hypothetical protein
MSQSYPSSMLASAPSEAALVDSVSGGEAIYRSRFRKLLLLAMSLWLIALVIENWKDNAPVTPLYFAVVPLMVLSLLLIAATVWNCVELYRFKASAPKFAVVITGLWLLMVLGSHLFVTPSLEGIVTPSLDAATALPSAIALLVSDLSTLLWGALLAMMFLKPFSSLFRH